MKAIKYVVGGLVLLCAITMHAQVSVKVHISPPPPLMRPAAHPAVMYYYLPDAEAYYDVNTSMYIYFSGGNWIHRATLPPRYKGYDYNHGYKVLMPDYHGEAPYSHFKEHKMKYARGYRGEPQHGHDNHNKNNHDHGGDGNRK